MQWKPWERGRFQACSEHQGKMAGKFALQEHTRIRLRPTWRATGALKSLGLCSAKTAWF
jgi:hypothetical protein